jgi:hypothetical protein
MRHDHGERWGPRDLIRRVQNAFDVAGRAVDAAVRYRLQSDSHTGADANLKVDEALVDVRPLVMTKVVAEAAMLLRCAAPLRHVDGQMSSIIDDLAQRIIAPARGRRLLTLLCLEPTLALDHAAAHIHLSDLGFRDPAVDRMLLEIFQGEVIGGPERLPMQELEQQWLRGVWPGDKADVSDNPDLSALLARTCIGRPIDILGCRTQDLYAFTHVLLYASDMGRQSNQWPRPLEEIAHDADAALAAAIDANNFDLAAELIWTWPMLRLPWSPAATFSFGVLAAMQDECGFLPGPDYSSHDRERLPEDLRDEYVLRTSYHATVVMGFACAMALSSSHVPPVTVCPVAGSEGRIEQIQCLLRDESREPRWRSVFSQLDANRRGALDEFLLTMALRRARASRDLELLREGLAIGLRCDMVDGLTARHALALLRRATMLGHMSAEDLEIASTSSD